jgi:hypothetical protein
LSREGDVLSVKIYAGNRKYSEVFPKHLKRGLTFYNLTQAKGARVLTGKYPTEQVDAISLTDLSTKEDFVFSLTGEGTWVSNLAENVATQYKNALVILER